MNNAVGVLQDVIIKLRILEEPKASAHVVANAVVDYYPITSWNRTARRSNAQMHTSFCSFRQKAKFKFMSNNVTG